MIINENCWQYCQYAQSWQLYLLKFVQVVHEIDTAFLHLHVSIISISLSLHNWAVFSRLCAAALLCGRDQDCLKRFSTKTLMHIVF